MAAETRMDRTCVNMGACVRACARMYWRSFMRTHRCPVNVMPVIETFFTGASMEPFTTINSASMGASTVLGGGAVPVPVPVPVLVRFGL